MSGLLIAGKVLNISRIGITLDTILELGIPISEVAEDLPERINKHADAVERLYLDGFISEKDWNFLNSGKCGRRAEIDNVLAYVGAERFWRDYRRELFPSRDYRRSIYVPELISPSELQATIDFVHRQVKDILKPEYEKNMSKLKNYEGFISDATGEENAILCGMQDKLKESNRLRRYLEELEALRIKYNSNP